MLMELFLYFKKIRLLSNKFYYHQITSLNFEKLKATLFLFKRSEKNEGVLMIVFCLLNKNMNKLKFLKL